MTKTNNGVGRKREGGVEVLLPIGGSLQVRSQSPSASKIGIPNFF